MKVYRIGSGIRYCRKLVGNAEEEEEKKKKTIEALVRFVRLYGCWWD